MESPHASQMEELLQQLGREGQFNSKGQFTLALDKLCEKLAAFQFERSSKWILKVVQGLVASGATSIFIKQSYSVVEIRYHWKVAAWTHQDLELAFLSPELESKAAVRHLATALWFVTFRLGATWKSVLEGVTEALCGSTRELSFLNVETERSNVLEIVYPGEQRQSLLRSLFSHFGATGPSRAAELSRELALFAYTCPVPLSLDHLRLDNLCSWATCYPRRLGTGGSREQVYVAAVGWGEAAEAAAIVLPPNTRPVGERFGPTQFGRFGESDGPVHWMALLTGHIQMLTGRGESRLAPFKGPSSLNWVRDGIIVRQDVVPISCAASCQLFVSADHLAVDLSGLKLIDSASVLSPSVRTAVTDWLSQQRFGFEFQQSQSRWYDKIRDNVGLVTTTAVSVAAIGVVPVAAPEIAVASVVGIGTAFYIGFDKLWAKTLPSAGDTSKLEGDFILELSWLAMVWAEETWVRLPAVEREARNS